MNAALLALLLAFPGPAKFDVPAIAGGGSGGIFSGSPRAKYDCAVCHVGAGAAKLTLSAPGDSPLAGYEPGRSYELELSIEGANEASAVSLEIVGRSGAPVGVLSPAPLEKALRCTDGADPLEIRPDGVAALSRSCRQGLGIWRVIWTAPASDVGGVVLYAAAVDGDLDGTHLGDRTGAVTVAMPSPSTPPLPRPASCAGGSAGALLLPLGLVLGWRRRGSLLAALLCVGLTAGAAQARPKKKRAVPAKKQPAPVVEDPVQQVPQIPAPSVEVLPHAPAPDPPVPAAPTAPQVIAAPQEGVEPPGAEAWAAVGAGSRSLTLVSSSLLHPVRVTVPAYPEVSAGLTLYPARLARLGFGGGVFLSARYVRGAVMGGIPFAAEPVASRPSRALLRAGYALQLGPITVSPALSYAAGTGGIERNKVARDGITQSWGVEVPLQLRAGPWEVGASGRAAGLVRAGEAEVDYGPLVTGRSYGGELFLHRAIGKDGLWLGFRGAYFASFAVFAGGGDQAYGRLETEDRTATGALFVEYRL